MVAVCEKCGTIGYEEYLIYCSSCRVSAEHRYCLDEYPNVSKQCELAWECPDCAPLNLGRRSERIIIKKEQTKCNKQQKNPKHEPVLAAAIGVNSKSTAAGSCLSTEGKIGPDKKVTKYPKTETGAQQYYVKLEQEEKKRHSPDGTISNIEAPAEEKVDFGKGNPIKPNTRLIGSDEDSELVKNGGYSSDESGEFRAVRRKSLPRKGFISKSHGSLSEENPEPVGVTSEASVAMEGVGDSFPGKERGEGKREGIVRGLQRCSDFEPHSSKGSREVPYDYYKADDGPHHLNLSESSKDLRVYPLTDPVWRGWFNISKRKKDTRFRLGAYLSDHACTKACDASRVLSPILDLEILPKSDIWPNIFKVSAPTVEAIALFFFPEYERDEAVFDDVLDGMIGKGLALRSVFAEFELLVFSSLEFPYEDWRICRKYYMWGVFQERGHL